eukprot:5611349-Prymnesium_polylepis.1
MGPRARQGDARVSFDAVPVILASRALHARTSVDPAVADGRVGRSSESATRAVCWHDCIVPQLAPVDGDVAVTNSIHAWVHERGVSPDIGAP